MPLGFNFNLLCILKTGNTFKWLENKNNIRKYTVRSPAYTLISPLSYAKVLSVPECSVPGELPTSAFLSSLPAARTPSTLPPKL